MEFPGSLITTSTHTHTPYTQTKTRWTLCDLGLSIQQLNFMLKSWTPLQCKQVVKANLGCRIQTGSHLTWGPHCPLPQNQWLSSHATMPWSDKALGAPPQRYTSGVLIPNMNMHITSKSLDKQIVDVLYIQPIRDTLIWWFWLKKTHTPPKFNGWNLKIMVSKSGISKLPGVDFEVNHVKLQVIICSYSFQPIRHTLIW